MAIDLSAQLDSSKFLLAYSDFGITWVQKRGQAMRFVNIYLNFKNVPKIKLNIKWYARYLGKISIFYTLFSIFINRLKTNLNLAILLLEVCENIAI